jgi:fermentation-respiration switch protein FrsA (DUF1100 family)
VGFLGLERIARSLVFPGCDVALLDPAALARTFPAVEPFSYKTADGLELTGVLARSAEAGAPTIVYFHGNAESAAQNVPFAHDLAGRGVSVLVVEYRGYGGMPGSASEAGLYLDAEAAIAALLAKGVSREELVLVGRSLGSGVATEFAHRGYGRALVLVSPFTSVVDMARRIAGPAARFLIEDRFENARKLPELSVPVTIVHAVADDVVPYEHGRTLAGLAKRARLVTLETGDHSNIPGLEAIVAEAAKAHPR